jgi:uncharacterized membrane protein YkoI
MRRLPNYLLIISYLLIQGVGIASAQNHSNNFFHTTSGRQTEISQQQAAAIAQKHVSGRVLSVNRSTNSYLVKILNSKGNIQVVTVSARDGAILSTR